MYNKTLRMMQTYNAIHRGLSVEQQVVQTVRDRVLDHVDHSDTVFQDMLHVLLLEPELQHDLTGSMPYNVMLEAASFIDVETLQDSLRRISCCGLGILHIFNTKNTTKIYNEP